MGKLNGLDLFSGIGGITLALDGWVRPVAYCEIDRYAQSVLLSRISDGKLPRAPIWDDITSLDGAMLPSIDIIYGGFPCQDISVAGNGVGLGGKRSGLFNHIARLIEETNPRFVFLENVPAIRTRGLNSVAQTFTELGYDCRWTFVSAAEVGAPHLRKRWFLLAYTNSQGLPRSGETRVGKEKKRIGSPTSIERRDWWTAEPNVGRVVNGLPFRVDRIKALGNAVVPTQVSKAFKKLIGLEKD